MALSKDCTCTDHEGPHWLYEFWAQERVNLAALQEAIDDRDDDLIAAADTFFWAEFERKSTFVHRLERSGIEHIPPELIPPPPPKLRYPCDQHGRPHPIIERLAELMGWSIPVQTTMF